jgi:hypothetical protein
LKAIRAQLRKLSDAELIREGRAMRQLSSPWNGKPPRRVFVVGLEECSAEVAAPAW